MPRKSKIPPKSESGSSSAGETSSPAGETSSPAGETSSPAGETSDPAGETSDPAGETSSPAGETPIAEGDTSESSSEDEGSVGDEGTDGEAPGTTEMAATKSSQGSVTERGWDGWPTKPTPNYLIPKMGEVPVSSTVHFQSVVMTSLEDSGIAADMWAAIKKPLIEGLRRRSANAARDLVVTRAIYGNFADDAVFPSKQARDVTPEVERALQGTQLEIAVNVETFPQLPKGDDVQLRVYFPVGTTQLVRDTAVGQTFRFNGALQILNASYNTIGFGGVQTDVTEIVRGRIDNNRLRFSVSARDFGVDNSNSTGRLGIEYSIDGNTKTVRGYEGEEVRLDGPTSVQGAYLGEQPPVGCVDVTDQVAALVDDGQLTVEALNDTFGFDPAFNVLKRLRVEYRRGGIRGIKSVKEYETLSLFAEPGVVDPTDVFKQFFVPAPESPAELADRLTQAGLVTTDFDAEAELSTMDEWLDGVLGVSSDKRLDPVDEAEADELSVLAEGAILYHEQGWYGRGLALGNLLHSVALAPGEVTQVAMTHWNHTTRSTDDESVSQADSASASSQQNRSVSEIQDASVREHQWGSSAAESTATSMADATSSTSAHGSLGFFGSVKGGVEGRSTSFGQSHNISTAVTQSAGDKNVAMTSNQQINGATKRHSEAARTRRASVVREISQSEDENITTRVLANYNHMHALTMMYFEVIEVFSLRTRVVDAERVIFLPFKVRDVIDLVPKYAAVLIDAANATGRSELARAIQHYRDREAKVTIPDPGNKPPTKTVDTLEGAISTVSARLDKAEDRVKDKRTELTNLPTKRATDRGNLRTEIDILETKRSAVISSMSSFTDLPGQLGKLAARALHAQLAPIEEQVAQANEKLGALQEADTRERLLLETDLRTAAGECKALERELRVLEETKMGVQNLKDGDKSGPFHENKLFFNQAVWLSLSSGEILSMAKRHNRYSGDKLGEHIDPAPVALTGNYVGYRWRFADNADSQRFKRQYVRPFIGDPEQELATVKADIAVPTGGVFGEAVLGEAVSAEKIDLSRFWNWQDSMIPILPTSINPISAATPTIQDLDATPMQLDASSAELTPLQELPAPSGFGALAQTMQAQIFRDMSGQGLLQELATATTAAAQSSEQHAADVAKENLKAGLDFISDMADKAISVAAAPETGGASLLGGMTKSKDGGGATVLGGVLNANEAGGNGDVLAKLTGGKPSESKAGKETKVEARGDEKSASEDKKPAEAEENGELSPGMRELK